MRTLVISDLHFGSGHELLASGRVRRRLLEAIDQRRPQRLVVLGDLLDLTVASFSEAVAAARPFLADVSDCGISELLYVPGNHDHHLVEREQDARRVGSALGIEPAEPFAEIHSLLGTLCEGPEIRVAYPLVEIDGITFTHGHYLTLHLDGLGNQIVRRFGERFSGLTLRRGLGAAEYEELIGPLEEMLYQLGQLSRGRHSRQRSEALFERAFRICRSPGRLAGRLRRRPSGCVTGAFQPLPSAEQSVRAMAQVIDNLGVPAEAKVCFAHTHTAFAGHPCGGRTYHNPGSWIYDRREQATIAADRSLYGPGTALLVESGRAELLRLLDDLTLAELEALVPARPPTAPAKSACGPVATSSLSAALRA